MDLLIPTLQILIAFQCFSFAGFLSFDQRLALGANRVLFGLLMVLGIHMVFNLINQHVYIGIVPDFAIGLGFLYGPLIYLYTQSLTLQTFKLSPKHIWHGGPSILVVAATLITMLPTVIYAYGIFLSLFIYFILSHRKLKQYRIVLEHTRSNFDQVALNWLSWLLRIQILLLTTNILSVHFYIMGMKAFGFWSEVGLFIALLILINTIIFKGLMHPELFAGISQEDQNLVDSAEEESIPVMSSEESIALLKVIDAHMETKQPYLNPSLTIKQLGLQIITNPRHVSQAINSERDMNFSEYVNSYRVRVVKHLLADPEARDRSILDIMLEAGFNTKSNFNRSFKIITGMTPLQYRRMNDPEITS